MRRGIAWLLTALAMTATLASASGASGAPPDRSVGPGPAVTRHADFMMGPGCGASTS